MLSVVFSSFNGKNTVGRMLEACCGLKQPEGGWKIIAADNGSTDGTGDIMRSFAGRLPIEVLSVAARGKNRALNAALEHLEGDLVVFTDDDVIPDPLWLHRLESCARVHPGHALFAGPILPHWPHQPESWILECVYLEMAFALSDPKQGEGEVPAESVWGPNMAVRRALFDQGLRFNEEVGPDGSGTYMMGSETEFTRRVARTGARAWFCVDARVQHMIRENQMERAWILQRYFRHGRSAYYFNNAGSAKVPMLFGAERWLYGQLLRHSVLAAWHALTGDTKKRFTALAGMHFARGSVHQSRLMHARSPSSVGSSTTRS